MSAKNYKKEVTKQLDYFPTWLPGKEMYLGEVGYFAKGEFIHVTTLEDLGITFQTVTDKSKNDFKIGSNAAKEKTLGLDITAPISYKMIKDAGLKISFAFQKKNKLVFITKGLAIHSIKNTLGIGSEIKRLCNANVWKNNWKVITEIAETDTSTILFTKEDNAEIELKPNVSIGMDNIELIDADLKWEIVNSHGFDVEIIAQEKFIPLFMARKIKKVNGDIGKIRGRAFEIKQPNKESLIFEKINLEDLDDE